ncbi:carboxymuconolactone decarboxylase family protein [Gammaproteobacteria bacterium AB-CW1]|uniref:Carboxymuconolactone decarboxylase family protein n=1 Tax=Natronospira elongata TaxID=3110268 RepID=A0AAP6JGM0_9GAMM|nr:carboxymuconolactone decarboxylase family protein [Gammaproteobacteria bacterium AB-CW1]
MTAEYRIQQDPVTLDNADEKVKPLLQDAKDTLGFVPSMYAHMAKAPGVLSSYLHGYEYFRELSGFEPAEQEVILLTISRANGCAYCMSAHSMIAEQVSQVPADTLAALRNDEAIPDPKLAALSRFTRVMFDSRGRPDPKSVEAFLNAGYQESHIMQIVLALAVKTLSNYANHLNHPELDQAFAGHKWEG